MPVSHRRYAEISPSALIEQAKSIGDKTAYLIHKILSDSNHPEKGYRSAHGILRTAKNHKNNEEVELASAKMLSLGIKRTFHLN